MALKIKRAMAWGIYHNGIISTTAPGSEETDEQPAEAALKRLTKGLGKVYSANVRKEPNTVSSIVTKLCDSFTRISSNGTWSYIETKTVKRLYD